MTLNCQNFLRRRQTFEKSQKRRFRHFSENFDKKNYEQIRLKMTVKICLTKKKPSTNVQDIPRRRR